MTDATQSVCFGCLDDPENRFKLYCCLCHSRLSFWPGWKCGSLRLSVRSRDARSLASEAVICPLEILFPLEAVPQWIQVRPSCSTQEIHDNVPVPLTRSSQWSCEPQEVASKFSEAAGYVADEGLHRISLSKEHPSIGA
jgi:hypothetical protein